MQFEHYMIRCHVVSRLVTSLLNLSLFFIVSFISRMRLQITNCCRCYFLSVQLQLFAYWSLWSLGLWILTYINASLFHTVTSCTKPETNRASASTRDRKFTQGDRLHDDDNSLALTSRTQSCNSPTVNRHQLAFKSNARGDQSTEAGASDCECDQRRSSTVIRKQFHIAAVVIFVPGLLYDPQLLYMASTCALVVLIMVEVGCFLRELPCLSWNMLSLLRSHVGRISGCAGMLFASFTQLFFL
jgi:hypothetical protein